MLERYLRYVCLYYSDLMNDSSFFGNDGLTENKSVEERWLLRMESDPNHIDLKKKVICT